MTVAELKQLLDEAGIEYSDNAKKEELEKLLKENEEIPEAEEHYVYASTHLNVRKEPSKNSPIVKTLRPDEKIVITGEVIKNNTGENWYKTSDGNYVMAKWTKLV